METKDILIKIFFAILASGLIGYEREIRKRPAGFRTHILVCVGATIVALIQLQLVNDTVNMIKETPELANSLKADIGRVIGQVVTGVGFLGAGTIIFHNGSVKGLTTATSLWAVACLGLAIGLGYYVIAIIATFAILFVVVSLKRIEDMAIIKSSLVQLNIKYNCSGDDFTLNNIIEEIKSNGGSVTNIRIFRDSDSHSSCNIDFRLKGLNTKEALIKKIGQIDNIISIDGNPKKG